MNVIESIYNINNVVEEVNMLVVESMMNVIDKHEMIIECDNETLDEMFMESMEWFLESKNRERDRTPRNDIAKWMDEHGYWVTSKNDSKRKKECNRMYHFLQQWDFDPKTETIKTDIKLSNGSNKRIKLNIDKAKHKWDLASLNDGNAWYDPEDKAITMGSKTLKGKQTDSQITGKHEEGHADDDVKRGTKGHRKDINKIKGQYSKLIDGKPYVNYHDKKPNEGYADAYAVMHARKRTKDWGKNKETRPLNRSEVEGSFKRMANSLAGVMDTVTAAKSKVYGTISDLQEFLDKDWADYNVNIRDIREIIKLQHEYDKRMEGFDKAIEQIGDKLNDPQYTIDNISRKYNQLRELERTMKNMDKGYAIKDIEKEYYEVKATIDILSNSSLYNMNSEDTKNKVGKDITEKLKLHSFKEKGYIKAYSMEFKIDRKLADKIFNTKDITEEKAISMAKEHYKPSIKQWIAKLEKTLETLDEYDRTGKHMKDLSTQIRYEFAKQFVKEYFAELFDDMYIAE